MNKHDESRRNFIKKVAYTAPVIFTMNAMPAFAKSGSGCTTRYDWSKDSEWNYDGDKTTSYDWDGERDGTTKFTWYR